MPLFTPFSYIASGVSFDPDAQAFIDAAGITDATQQQAIDTLVITMKDDGVWDKMYAVYPFVGGTATTHKYNLIDPQDSDAAYRMTFSGGWTHDSNGVKGNGSNTYARTFWVPNTVKDTDTDLSTNFSMGFYNRTDAAANAGGEFGAANGGSGGDASYTMLMGRSNGESLTDMPQPNNRAKFSGGNKNGFFHYSRASTTAGKLFQDGTLRNTATNTAPTNQYPTVDLTLGSQQRPTLNFPDGYSNRNYAFCFIGKALTDTEMSDYYDAVQAYQTTLGREV
jgi:hypothetical protein